MNSEYIWNGRDLGTPDYTFLDGYHFWFRHMIRKGVFNYENMTVSVGQLMSGDHNGQLTPFIKTIQEEFERWRDRQLAERILLGEDK